MSEAEVLKYEAGKEDQKNTMKSIDWALSNANIAQGTNLKGRKMERTAAVAQEGSGGEIRFLPDKAGQYRVEAERLTAKEISEFAEMNRKIMSGIDAKMERVEVLKKLFDNNDKKTPANIQPVLGTLNFDFVSAHKKSLENLEFQSASINNVIDSSRDKQSVREGIQKYWNVDNIPLDNGAVDAAFIKEVKLAVGREYTKKLAEIADDLTTQVNALPFEDALKALNAKIRVSTQSQRDIMLDQNPARAKFLNRIAGTATADQLIAMALDAKNKTIDLDYLAYCIRYTTDVNKSADVEYRELLRAVSAGTSLIPNTEENKKILSAYINTRIKQPNPPGASPQNILLRSYLDKKVVDKLELSKEIFNHLSVKTLLLFRDLGVKEINKTNIRDVLLQITREKDLSKKDFIEVLTFLAFRAGTGKEWGGIESITSSLCERMIEDKVIAIQGEKIVIEKGNEEEFKSRLGDAFFDEEALSLVNDITKQDAADIPWEKDVEFLAKPIADVAQNGFSYALGFLKDILNDFRTDKPGDKALGEHIKDKDAAKSAISAISAITNLQKDYDKKLILEVPKVENVIKTHGKNREELKKHPGASADILMQYDDASGSVKVSRDIHDELERDSFFNNAPMEQQDIAFWLAINRDMATAKKYLASKNPDIKDFNLTTVEDASLHLYLHKLFLHQHLKGVDILLDMKHTHGVEVHPLGLEILQKTRDSSVPNGVQLSAGPGRPDQWFAHPENAEGALHAVLVGNAEPKNALIRAFVTKEQQTYVNAKGKTVTIDPIVARDMIGYVQQHLERQRADYEQSIFQSKREARSSDPLDILRGGTDALGAMFKSGDRLQQGLALAMIFASAAILWKTWTKGGKIGKGLILGSVAILGGDVVMRKMLGKGILERLGLNYMNKKDRTAAVEQFMRKYAAQEKYAFLDVDKGAGKEAMNVLTDPARKVPVRDLVAWHRNVRANNATRPNFKLTMPASLRGAVGDILAKLPTIDRRSYEEKEQEACRHLYLSFEALCEEVAERNHLSNPKVENGEEFIEQNYVLFKGPLLGQYHEEISKVAQERGGFSMLDVLITQRPTPAMQAEFDRVGLAEMLEMGVTTTAGNAREILAQNIARAQIYAAYGVQIAPDYYENAKDYLKPRARDTYEYLRGVFENTKQATKEEAYAAARFVSGTLSAFGIMLTKNGPEMTQNAWEGTVWGGRKGVDALQNAYRILHKNGLVFGPMLDAHDRIWLAVTGSRFSDWVLYEAAMETADPVKLDEHVQGLASNKNIGPEEEQSKWAKKFVHQLEMVSTGVDVTKVNGWIKEAKAEFKTPPPTGDYQEMVVYELVKRRVYSYILQHRERGNSKAKVDLKDKTWGSIKTEGSDVESTYGLVTLQLLETEKTDRNVDSLGLPVFASSILNAVANKFPHAIWERRDARQYLKGLNEAYTYFHRSAVAAFPEGVSGNAEKLEKYDAFLETMLTNAVIDMMLGQAAGLRDIGVKNFPSDATLPSANAIEPLKLMIDQAQGFLNALRAGRGNSADAAQVKQMDLAVFNSAEDIGKIQRFIPKEPEKNVASVAGPLSEDKKNSIQAALISTSTDVTTLEELSAGNTVEFEQHEEVTKKFNSVATTLAAGLPQTDTKKALITLQNATVLRKEMLKNIIDVNKSPEHRREMVELAAKMRDAVNSRSPDILNEVVDRGVILALEVLLKEIQDVKIDEVSKNPKQTKHWAPELVTLYKATKTPQVRDTASQLLEYVLYQIKNNGTNERGKTGYDKYLAYLKENGVDISKKENLPPESAWRLSPNAKTRMSNNKVTGGENVLKASVNDQSLSRFVSPSYYNDNLKSGSVADKILIIKHELDMK